MILLGANLHSLGDPTCTQASVDQSAVTICGCGQQLSGTQRVQPSQLTRGESGLKNFVVVILKEGLVGGAVPILLLV